MSLRIIAISDTHEKHEEIVLPEGDALIHAGDFTNRGNLAAIDKFFTWLDKQSFKYKCVTAGNHELSLQGPNQNKAFDLIKKFQDKGINFLLNNYVDIEGFKTYLAPWSPRFFNWAFNKSRGPEIAAEWAKIPLDTNILVTHGPPYGALDLVQDNFDNAGRDLHQGCKDLRAKIKELKQLRLSVSGHLHLQGGQSTVIDGVTFVNAAICNENYQPINKPVIIDL